MFKYMLLCDNSKLGRKSFDDCVDLIKNKKWDDFKEYLINKELWYKAKYIDVNYFEKYEIDAFKDSYPLWLEFESEINLK